MDKTETTVMDPEKVFFAHELAEDDYWMDNAIEALGENVFITFDLDALDPSIMPSTGTPEPGGMLWYETLEFLKRVFDEKNVVGFDIVELCPQKTERSSDFLAAKLYYKMLSYKFLNEITDIEDFDEFGDDQSSQVKTKINSEENDNE